jgi:hypothetical protein
LFEPLVEAFVSLKEQGDLGQVIQSDSTGPAPFLRWRT